MANPHDHPTALKNLQDSICREKVLRARAMTPEERLESVLELSEFQLGMMHAGEAWKEVRRGLDRLARAYDHRFYSSTNHEPHPVCGRDL